MGCQLYPYYAPSQLLNRFFRLYHQWNWPKPIMLCEVIEPHGSKVWNPKTNPADRQHIMPVITPAFPAMNSTHNVTETTKRILLDEFSRGFEVMKSIEAKKAEWSEVYEPFPYFTRFRHFLWLEILAKTDDAFKRYCGWVESKLRILTMQLETVVGMIIHPNPVQYGFRESEVEWPEGCGMFIALDFTREAGAYPGQTVDLRPAISMFVDVIHQWSEKDSYPGQFQLRITRVSSAQLPPYALHEAKEAAARKKRKQIHEEPEEATDDTVEALTKKARHAGST